MEAIIYCSREVFEFEGTLLLKTNKLDYSTGERICVCLENGLIEILNEEDFVYKCEAKIVVK